MVNTSLFVKDKSVLKDFGSQPKVEKSKKDSIKKMTLFKYRQLFRKQNPVLRAGISPKLKFA
jgi:hypothetical protein